MSARLPASQLVRHPVQLQTRSARNNLRKKRVQTNHFCNERRINFLSAFYNYFKGSKKNDT